MTAYDLDPSDITNVNLLRRLSRWADSYDPDIPRDSQALGLIEDWETEPFLEELLQDFQVFVSELYYDLRPRLWRKPLIILKRRFMLIQDYDRVHTQELRRQVLDLETKYRRVKNGELLLRLGHHYDHMEYEIRERGTG
jgi:hypothetical protein